MSDVDEDGGAERVSAWARSQLARTKMSPTAIGAALGMDLRTLNKILDGGTVARHRMAALADFFGYEADAFDRVRRGEKPVMLGNAVEIQAGAPMTDSERLGVLEQSVVWLTSEVRQIRELLQADDDVEPDSR